ncbi:unnamed protein product [Onchocerca flexuosa]|uniref:Secreted protein n=1 Tax=Onchocerca flexuosa TaxID=387005 RepID=A0A183HST3_9BILA|nr:unnamed protein product [Onchocerca flexuosa]
MLVYVYSSAERFFGVLIFILLVWFIQARRDRNNRERADRELAAAVNNVRQPQEVSKVCENFLKKFSISLKLLLEAFHYGFIY